jgi:hypothetical protein
MTIRHGRRASARARAVASLMSVGSGVAGTALRPLGGIVSVAAEAGRQIERRATDWVLKALSPNGF